MSADPAASALPIRLNRVSKRYGSTPVLDNVSLAIEGGEFVTLLGPSGSGKTTILNIIAGFTRPDRGRVHFDKDDVTLLPPHRRNLGVVFQNYALFPHMNVAANVAFPLRARSVPRAQIAERTERALRLVELGGFGDRRVDQLSGGQKQRVALARALVFEPKIILMDEPLSALDKQLRETMQIELRRLHNRLGATTIYVTHDQREALTMSDRIAVLNKGVVAQFDTPRVIYEQPADRFVARFLGESALVPVERAGPRQIRLGESILACARPVPDAGALQLVLRGEALRPARDGDENLVGAGVREVIYHGNSLLLMLELPGGHEAPMRLGSEGAASLGALRPGDRVTLTLPPERAIVVSSAE